MKAQLRGRVITIIYIINVFNFIIGVCAASLPTTMGITAGFLA
jgi:hypothetical protein